MNFASKFDGVLPVGGAGAHDVAHFHVNSLSTHVPVDAIIVPDAHLLFGADFKRSGVDLILSNDDRELVLHDYFKGEKHAPLASPDGAHLTGDIVNALTGHVEYAQADGSAAAAVVVGHVTKLTGNATAIRNGVSIILNSGDNVDKGDVLQSGSDSTLGVTFVDGTVFGLASNARMVVNEMIYDPNGSNNSSLLSLVQGTISFVAGETAKHGDMKVDTPVATMGIRGTAVLVQIDFDIPGQTGVPDAKFQVLVEPDGHTGSYILFDKTTLAPIATVNEAGHQVNISQGSVSYSSSGLSPELQKLITDVFTLKFTDNTNPNTKSFDHFTDSIVPLVFTPFKFVNVPNLTPIIFAENNANSPVQSNSGPATQIQHIPIAPTVSAHGGAEAERIGVTGDNALDTVSGKISFSDLNVSDRPTATAAFDAVSYQTTQHQDVTSLLSKQQLTAIEAAITVSQDSGNTNQGTATWTYSISDKAFDFLGAGETLTLTYLIRVSNNYSPDIQVTTVPITITITGTNDVPVITSSVPHTIGFNGGAGAPGGDLVATGPTSGKMTFSDPDLTDTHKVSVAVVETALDGSAVTLPSTPLNILESALSASIATDSTDSGAGTINWSLADLPASLEDFIPVGETLTITYAVTVTDSQGATATQDITVTIGQGVVWVAKTADGAPSGGLWSNPSDWSTGAVPSASDDVIIITDQQFGLTPSFPVTIDAPAVAESVTMNDLGTSAPELINESTLTIGGAFSMSADSIAHNSGTISVGGLMEVLDQSVLQNSGTINLHQGGDFKDHSTISNTVTGTIEISGGTLNVEVDIANSGRITVDPGAALTIDQGSTVTNTGVIGLDDGATGIGELTVNDATIDGGSILNSGAIKLTGAGVLKNGSLQNFNYILVSGIDNALHNETVTGGGGLEILPGGALTIDQGSTVTDPHSLEVDAGTLTLNDATINTGVVYNDPGGTIDLTGSAVFKNGWLYNFGQLNVSGTGNALHNENLSGNAALEVLEGGTLVIDQSTIVANSGGTITVDDTATLTLNDVTVTSGTVTNKANGIIDLTGTAVLKNGTLGNSGVIDFSGTGNALDNELVTNTGTIEVLALGALTLDQLTAVSNAGGTIAIDGTGTLTLNGATIDGGTINDYSTVSGSIVAGDIDVTGSSTISNASLNKGQVTIESGQMLTLDGTTVTGSSITDSGTVNVNATQVLKLNDVALSGGAISNAGTVEITGSSSIENDTLGNTQLTVDKSQTLTLDGTTITGGTVTNNGTVVVDAGQTLVLQGGVALVGGTLENSGTVEIESSSGATLDGVTITGPGTIQVDSDASPIATSLVLDDGTIVMGGALTVGSVGTLAVKTSGGAALNKESVTNDNSIEVFAASLLLLAAGTTVANKGTITVDSTGTLALNDATITGGTIADNGMVHVTGDSSIDSADVTGGHVTIDAGKTLILDGVTVNYTSFSDTATGAIIRVDGGDTLTLYNVTIDGGTINDYSGEPGNIVSGLIDITGSSKISDAGLNHGHVTVEGGQVLTLDNVTVSYTSFDDSATGAVIQVDGGDKLTLNGATINGGTINDYSTVSSHIVAGDIDITGSSTINNASLNHGDVTIESGQTLTLDDVTVAGTSFTNVATGSTIHVDSNDKLALSGVTVSGGAVTVGTHALVQVGDGGVTLTNTSVANNGTIEVLDGSTLKLAGSITGSGSVQIDGGGQFELNGSDTQNVVFDGSKAELKIDGSSFGGNIVGLSATDQLDLQTIGYGPDTTGTYVSNANNTGGVLTITDGTHSISMTLVGDYRNAHFAGSSDGNGGTLVTLNAADDAPAFTPADTTQTATVTELANTTGSSASDSSSPAGGIIHFTDVDLTDRPTATITAQSVTLTSANHTDLSSSLTPSELSALEHALVLTETGNTNNGAIDWTYSITDSALDFLGAGQTATVTSTITLNDHEGGTDKASVTITINGANDVPTIVSETNPSVQTFILAKSPIVLGTGVTTNSLGLPTETFDSLSAGSASNNGFGHGNFTSAALDATFVASGDAGIVHGSSSVTAAPFVGPSPGHADTTNYLSIGAHGSETITFASLQNEFGLDWGSADSFNTIQFYDGNTLVASYTGADVAPLLANGNQGSFSSNGYVEFSDLGPFNKVVLASGSSNAFEIDNISAGYVSDSHNHLPGPITGTLTVSDADIGDTLTASVTGDAVAEYNGSTTLPPNVDLSALIDSKAVTFDSVTSNGGSEVLDWTYNPANANFDFLEPGDKLTLTFDAQVTDGHVVTGDQPLTVTIVGTGASVVTGTPQNDTFVNVGGGVKIFGGGGQDTFVFNANFHSATIGDFDVNKDTIDISQTLFASVSAILSSAQSANSGHDTVITDAAHDTITLSGVTLAQIQAHPNDFHLV
ncbi:Npun_F0296 family exosortase-dependent surface protein [Bradyrhizobium canariense]|uniref:FecR family protein n=1 Tax=Bradyrhizobium canariense TaxID=255045 RepID=A0A1H1ZX45_9BRAD|nr:FecR domain-containing protein [Bradyrhizobium canariense]SDT38284.1 FecR family protein [Bradyrhizobium canariense]